MKQFVFSTAYLPPIDWFAHMIQSEFAIIDLGEYYEKQSFRNRCELLSANGKIALSIPVKKKFTKTPVKDMLIESDFNWQKQHWGAIVSAYQSAPYFFHYSHMLQPLFHTTFHTLYEWNHELIQVCFNGLEVNTRFEYSTNYVTTAGIDLRAAIHPKVKRMHSMKPYPQVFGYKFGFMPGLSILDLLFNCGPRSADYLV